jgi:hypothetical protein
MAKERAKKLVAKISGVKGINIRSKRGGTTLKEEAIKAGYSESYADSGVFKKTEIFNELIDIHLSNSKLAKVHSDLLGAADIQHYVFPKEKKKAQLNREQVKAIIESVPGCKLIYIKNDHYLGQVAFFQSPDSKSRREALDMAYKIRGHYAPEQIELTKRKYQDLSNKDLAELEQALIKHLLKK